MRKVCIAVLFLVGVPLMCMCLSCSSGASVNADQGKGRVLQVNPYETITADEAKTMIDENNTVVIDVRSQAEFDEAHLPTAVCIPLETITGEVVASRYATDEPLIVYCRTGVRSQEAARKLVALGYERVYNLGGIRDWPYETEKTV